MKPRIAIRELEIPTAPDAAGWPEFEAAMRVHYDTEAQTYETRDFAYTAREALPDYLDQENQPTRLFVAREGSTIVGVARYELEAGEDPQTVWMLIDVPVKYRGRGIGRALSEWLESVAHTDAVRKAIVYAPSAALPGARITALSGAGSVAADDRSVQALQRSGFRLEQVIRASRLPLPFDAASALADAVIRSGSGYRLHYWIDRTPQQWLDDLALFNTRMSTDDPSAGLEEPEDTWTPERVVESEARASATGRTTLFAAVEDVDSGRLIGFTTLSVPPDLDRAVTQVDTIVLGEHRGHRLGMLLKLANLDHLARERPGHPAVVTFNAEENRYMLDVNEAVGFVAVGYEGGWRKDLPR
ncbi:MAG TPA: GNAT family N-acetyltransferase [Galbitalea sp.]